MVFLVPVIEKHAPRKYHKDQFVIGVVRLLGGGLEQFTHRDIRLLMLALSVCMWTAFICGLHVIFHF